MKIHRNLTKIGAHRSAPMKMNEKTHQKLSENQKYNENINNI